MRRNVPRFGFVRRAVKRFMPGEDLASALAEAAALQPRGIGSILTQLGENVSDAAEARAVRDHYLGVLEAIAGAKADAIISVKPTQLGLDLDRSLARDHLVSLAEAAQSRGNIVWVDMEQSGYVDATLELVEAARHQYANVGICLQAYLYRTEKDLQRLVPQGIGIRLVKGAYAEPADVAYPKKADVDANFLALATRLLETSTTRGNLRTAFGTHDRALVDAIRMKAEAGGIPPEQYQVQMLYGIQRAEQERLATAGTRLMVLISYGAAWYPWYVRRLAERPANVWFVVKSLVG